MLNKPFKQLFSFRFKTANETQTKLFRLCIDWWVKGRRNALKC